MNWCFSRDYSPLCRRQSVPAPPARTRREGGFSPLRSRREGALTSLLRLEPEETQPYSGLTDGAGFRKDGSVGRQDRAVKDGSVGRLDGEPGRTVGYLEVVKEGEVVAPGPSSPVPRRRWRGIIKWEHFIWTKGYLDYIEKLGYVCPMSISPDNPEFRWTVFRWFTTLSSAEQLR